MKESISAIRKLEVCRNISGSNWGRWARITDEEMEEYRESELNEEVV